MSENGADPLSELTAQADASALSRILDDDERPAILSLRRALVELADQELNGILERCGGDPVAHDDLDRLVAIARIVEEMHRTERTEEF